MTGENVTIFVSQLGLGDNRVKTEINMSAVFLFKSNNYETNFSTENI